MNVKKRCVWPYIKIDGKFKDKVNINYKMKAFATSGYTWVYTKDPILWLEIR